MQGAECRILQSALCILNFELTPMPQPNPTMSAGKIQQALKLHDAGFGQQDIARLLEVPRQLIRQMFKNESYRLPGTPRNSKPHRCPECGHLVTSTPATGPCFECRLEAQKRINRAARFLISTPG
jgi:hypothetical protein